MLVKINTDNTKTNRIENSKLSLILQQITEDYMDSIQIENLEEKTIESLLQNLDPHSVYISKEDFHAANDDLAGRFDGIGVEFRMIKDTVVVIQALENGPSKRAGIQSGDRLLIANGDTLFGKNLKNTDIQHKIKGEKGTTVNLTIKRVGLSKPLNFVLTREAIPTFSIDAKFMINEETAYLKLSRFSATTTKEIKAALELLIEEGMQNLILDLRGNSGGFLEAAISVSNQFLDKGKTIVFTKGKNRPKDIYKANNNGLFEKGNLILLIDENSASAS
ncbi:MAG: S41 family peptidase, partial [Bacteroidota bacterium]